MVKSMKAKKIELVVDPVKANKEELKYKESELANREKIVVEAVGLLKNIDSEHKLQLEELELQKEEATIIKNSPLDYDSTEAFAAFQVKVMEHRLRKLDLKDVVLEDQYASKKSDLLEQLNRCEKDIPELQLRIGVLKNLLTK